jgi:hypothetical protein
LEWGTDEEDRDREEEEDEDEEDEDEDEDRCGLEDRDGNRVVDKPCRNERGPGGGDLERERERERESGDGEREDDRERGRFFHHGSFFVSLSVFPLCPDGERDREGEEDPEGEERRRRSDPSDFLEVVSRDPLLLLLDDVGSGRLDRDRDLDRLRLRL